MSEEGFSGSKYTLLDVDTQSLEEPCASEFAENHVSSPLNSRSVVPVAPSSNYQAFSEPDSGSTVPDGYKIFNEQAGTAEDTEGSYKVFNDVSAKSEMDPYASFNDTNVPSVSALPVDDPYASFNDTASIPNDAKMAAVPTPSSTEIRIPLHLLSRRTEEFFSKPRQAQEGEHLWSFGGSSCYHPASSNSATAPLAETMDGIVTAEVDSVSVPVTQVPSTGRKWNIDFQQLIKDHVQITESREVHMRTNGGIVGMGTYAMRCDEISKEIRMLTNEFNETAKQYVQIIVEDTMAEIPDERRRIKPASLGGVAGGQKFIHDGMIFKFAADFQGMFGGDEFAMKAASHELKGIAALLACKVELLHFPLMTVVDYCGFRMIATSILPLRGAASLVYGSCDGGKTVESSSEQVDKAMQSAAKVLNIKGHPVGDVGTMIYGPGDIEVHKGTDDSFYVVDTARLFPPEAPVKKFARGSHLYCLLRPEFVKRYETPLCSDAFSYWARDGIKEHNTEVREATAHLHDVTIPLLAKYIDSISDTDISKESLSRLFHQMGVNIRHSGEVYRACQNVNSKRFLAAEMLSRCAKSYIRAALRAIQTDHDSLELVVRQVVAVGISKMLGNDLQFWDTVVCPSILARFGNIDITFRTRPFELVLRRLMESLCIDLSPAAMGRLLPTMDLTVTHPETFDCELPIGPDDVLSVGSRCKETQLVGFYEGFAMTEKLWSLGNLYALSEQGKTLFEEALLKFQAALIVMPDDYSALVQIGCIYDRFKRDEDAAIEYFTRAIEVNPKWPQAHTKLACLLMDRKCRLIDAARHFSVAQSWRTGRPLGVIGNLTTRETFLFDGRFLFTTRMPFQRWSFTGVGLVKASGGVSEQYMCVNRDVRLSSTTMQRGVQCVGDTRGHVTFVEQCNKAPFQSLLRVQFDGVKATDVGSALCVLFLPSNGDGRWKQFSFVRILGRPESLTIMFTGTQFNESMETRLCLSLGL